MADRCDHCSVRMDGLEVHADDCPVRGPEIVAASANLKLENADLARKVQALELQVGGLQKIIEFAEEQVTRAMELGATDGKTCVIAARRILVAAVRGFAEKPKCRCGSHDHGSCIPACDCRGVIEKAKE